MGGKKILLFCLKKTLILDSERTETNGLEIPVTWVPCAKSVKVNNVSIWDSCFWLTVPNACLGFIWKKSTAPKNTGTKRACWGIEFAYVHWVTQRCKTLRGCSGNAAWNKLSLQSSIYASCLQRGLLYVLCCKPAGGVHGINYWALLKKKTRKGA